MDAKNGFIEHAGQAVDMLNLFFPWDRAILAVKGQSDSCLEQPLPLDAMGRSVKHTLSVSKPMHTHKYWAIDFGMACGIVGSVSTVATREPPAYVLKSEDYGMRNIGD
jgi:hypothetical protein